MQVTATWIASFASSAVIGSYPVGLGIQRIPVRDANKLGPFQDGLIVMLPRSELAEIVCGDAAFLRTVTVLEPT
jgi:hypothetical protein